MPNLPPDGEMITDDEKLCNPEIRNCQELMYVYEQKCRHCYGTGTAVSSGRKRSVSHTCTVCAGVGFVRHVTSRFQPELNGHLDGPTTMGREKPKPDTGAREKKEYGDWGTSGK